MKVEGNEKTFDVGNDVTWKLLERIDPETLEADIGRTARWIEELQDYVDMWEGRSTVPSKVEEARAAPARTEPADEYIDDDPLEDTGARTMTPGSVLTPKWEHGSSSSQEAPTIRSRPTAPFPSIDKSTGSNTLSTVASESTSRSTVPPEASTVPFESSTGTVVSQSVSDEVSAQHDWQVEGATADPNLEETVEKAEAEYYASLRNSDAFRNWFEFKNGFEEHFKVSMNQQKANLPHKNSAFTKLFKKLSPARFMYQLEEDYKQQVENAERVTSGNTDAILEEYRKYIQAKKSEEGSFARFVYNHLPNEYAEIISDFDSL